MHLKKHWYFSLSQSTIDAHTNTHILFIYYWFAPNFNILIRMILALCSTMEHLFAKHLRINPRKYCKDWDDWIVDVVQEFSWSGKTLHSKIVHLTNNTGDYLTEETHYFNGDDFSHQISFGKQMLSHPKKYTYEYNTLSVCK